MTRFSIRDLMLTTAVVLLAIGWSVDRQRLAARITELQFQLDSGRRLLESNGWTTTVDSRGVVFDRQADSNTEQQIRAAIAKSAELGAPQPKPVPPAYGETPNDR